MSILSAVQLVSEKMGVTVKANNLTDQLNAILVRNANLVVSRIG